MGSRSAARVLMLALALGHAAMADLRAADSRPNVLLCISDDQSYPHASAYGSPMVSTPAFDRVAKEGVLFTNAFGASPGCSPCRAALVTGRHTWQIEEAGTHASSFPAKYAVYPELLEAAGYFVGFTGKGWGPGKSEGFRPRNPAGNNFSRRTLKPPQQGISANDYAANFASFLEEKPSGRPFCFWYGGTEPHRGYAQGSGLAGGKRLADAQVPPFLPDRPEVRSDILDYAVEIEWFDTHLGRMLEMLAKSGQLNNTLVIVTSDNGMPFPRAKANCYEYGIHMPLAIRWSARVQGGRTVDDLVGFVDLTATILEAAGVAPSDEYPPAGKSILNILLSGKQGQVDPSRTAVYAARERHSSSRWNNLGYPQRCIRTPEFLYIRNFRPERWPAGDPQPLDDKGRPAAMHGGYTDIDGGPTLDFLVEHRDDPEIARYFHLAVDKRPGEELYAITRDPACLDNLADDPRHLAILRQLRKQLESYLRSTGDSRLLDGGEIWESYPRYSPLRQFPAPQ